MVKLHSLPFSGAKQMLILLAPVQYVLRVFVSSIRQVNKLEGNHKMIRKEARLFFSDNLIDCEETQHSKKY